MAGPGYEWETARRGLFLFLPAIHQAKGHNSTAHKTAL